MFPGRFASNTITCLQTGLATVCPLLRTLQPYLALGIPGKLKPSSTSLAKAGFGSQEEEKSKFSSNSHYRRVPLTFPLTFPLSFTFSVIIIAKNLLHVKRRKPGKSHFWRYFCHFPLEIKGRKGFQAGSRALSAAFIDPGEVKFTPGHY